MLITLKSKSENDFIARQADRSTRFLFSRSTLPVFQASELHDRFPFRWV